MSIAVGLGALGVASSLLSSILGQSNFHSQQTMSERQYKDMARRQDAVNQVSRLRAAGINPAFAYGQIQPGQATGTSIPSANPVPQLDLSGLAAIGQGIDLNDAQVRNVESQTQKNEQEAKGLTIDNMFKKEDWLSKIYGRDSQSWLNNQLADSAKLSVQYDKLSMKNRLRELQLNVELKDAEVTAQTISLQYLTPRLAAEINNLMAQQFVAYATGRASLTQAHAAIMQATTNNEEMKAKFGDDPNLRRQYSGAVYQGLLQQRYESQSREWQNTKGDLHTPIGSVSRVLDYNKDYETWRNNRKR